MEMGKNDDKKWDERNDVEMYEDEWNKEQKEENRKKEKKKLGRTKRFEIHPISLSKQCLRFSENFKPSISDQNLFSRVKDKKKVKNKVCKIEINYILLYKKLKIRITQRDS